MKNRLFRASVLLMSLAGILIWLYANSCTENVSCSNYTLMWALMFSVIKPLYFFSVTVLPFGLLLLFIKKEMLQSITISAWIGIIICGFIIFSFPPVEHGWMSYGFIRENVAWYVGIAYSIISVTLVAYKSWQLRKE